jgi:hypothetical protein
VAVRRRGVSFEEAASVFAGPLAPAVEDPVDPGRALLIETMSSFTPARSGPWWNASGFPQP